MYAGKIVESGPAKIIFENAKHPYSQRLIELMNKNVNKLGKLAYIEGQPPLPDDYPKGCRFHPRCGFAIPTCKTEIPGLNGSDIHWWACPVKN